MTLMRPLGELQGGQVTIGLGSAPLPLPGNHLPGLLSEAWVISVKDEGVGISPQDLAKVFDPFYTTKSGGKTHGLGLPTVRAIVEAHGGLVEVRSTLGKGSQFLVYLPKA